MAHIQQIEYCTNVQNKFPEKFKNVSVIDIGSLDINGNNRYLFTNPIYTGIDLAPGNNVDVISKGHEYKPGHKVDFVISTECLEHDKMWKETLKNCIDLLHSGGMLLVTCATTGRPEHGTSRSNTDWASPFTTMEWGEEYYKNLTESDFREVFNPDDIFSIFEFSTNTISKDLYFYGIKR